MKNILAVGAHFDDVELGVGGTLNYLAENGRNVFKYTITDNVTKSSNLKLDIKYETTQKSSLKACKVLGVKEIKNQNLVECTKLKYSKEKMLEIEDIIYKKKIDTIFMHNDDDLNQDHIEASKICKTASRHCKNVLMYQSNFYLSSSSFDPRLFFDITKNYKKKIRALNCYLDEHDRNNILFSHTLKRNEIFGVQVGVRYAEAFQVVRMLYE